MADIITIDGTALPAPAREGVTIDAEKIWSANTGRNESGKMVGTLVAVKTSIKVKFPPLTLAQVTSVKNLISKQWLNVTLSRDGTTIFTGECYAGAFTYGIYSMADRMPYAINAEVSLIER